MVDKLLRLHDSMTHLVVGHYLSRYLFHEEKKQSRRQKNPKPEVRLQFRDWCQILFYLLMDERFSVAVEPTELWRKPRLYLAQSTNGEGWGVFSSRYISKGDIVELAPLLLRFAEEEPEVLKGTILNNYHYQYWAWNGVTTLSQLVLSFGYMLYFNHSSQPNIMYQQFGKEPDIDNPGHAVALGYYALCDIPANAELLCDYGGPEWFRDRGLTLVDNPVEHMVPDPFQQHLSRHWTLTSKLYAGHDKDSMNKVIQSHSDRECEMIPYNMDTMQSNLSIVHSHGTSTGFGNVICTDDVEKGESLEVVPVLVLLKSSIDGSLLETISMEWKDLECPQDLITNDHVDVVLSNEVEVDPSAEGVRSITKTAKIQETILFALAGNLSLLWRHMTDYNARLVVERDMCNKSGFLVRLVVTRRIQTLERVIVKLPPMLSSSVERMVEELALTGQPVIPDLIS
jgi:hypothetical protein